MNGPEVLVTYAFCGHQGMMAIPMKNGVGALHSQRFSLCPDCEAVPDINEGLYDRPDVVEFGLRYTGETHS